MDIGLIIPSLGSSQLAFFAINEINLAIEKDSKHDFCIFYTDLAQPIIRPLCATLNINEIAGFNGMLIATNIDTALSLAKITNASKKIFYVWDLEWLRRGNQDFWYNNQAYRHEELELVTRSESYSKAIQNYSNRKVSKLISNFNLPHFIEMYDGHSKKI